MKKLNRRFHPRRSRGVIVLAAVALTVVASAGTVLADPGGLFAGSDNLWPYNNDTPAALLSPVLAAVGDISCQPGAPQGSEKATDVCTGGATATARNAAQNATAMQIETMKPALVAVLGDEQYQNGYYQDFESSFDKYWGAFKFIQRPAPGNHEFYDNHGQLGVRGLGYFDYYNGFAHNAADGTEVDTTLPNGVVQPTPLPDGQAGDYGQTGNGWYSYNLGAWHLISLNIECADEPGGCSSTGSWFASETAWLANDLKQDHSPCTLAYWHQPTFSSTASPFTSDSTEGQTADAWWQLLYQHHATLILNGHDHVYSRFAPMDPAGKADPRHGIREFIIGTGGEALDTVLPSTPNLQAWSDQYYGVMKLTLKPGGYDWDYQSAMVNPAAPAGTPASYSDTGSGSCNG
jgi:Calcineurin-like phosphoesterase